MEFADGVCGWVVEFMGGFMFVEKASGVVIRDRDGGGTGMAAWRVRKTAPGR
jgi:hypothetical protein